MTKEQQKLIEFIRNNPDCATKLMEAMGEKKELKVWASAGTGWICFGTGHLSLSTDLLHKYHELGLAGPTREFVEQTRDYLKVLAKLRRQTKGFVPDWADTTQGKHYVEFEQEDNSIETGCTEYYNRGLVYFATQEDAQAAADSLTPEEVETFKKGWPVYPMEEK